jgi:hypothetical protein
MCLAVRTLGVLDAHLLGSDPLGQAWVAASQLWSTARERRLEPLSQDAVHRITVAHVFCSELKSGRLDFAGIPSSIRLLTLSWAGLYIQ